MTFEQGTQDILGFTKSALGIGEPLKFVTAVKYTASIAKFVNNVVFLYDPDWTYGTTAESTLPLCFLFVKDWHEQSASDISEKPMMFYNSQKVANTSSVHGGVMNVVADNNIIKPRAYKLEVLVPFMPTQITNTPYLDVQTSADIGVFVNEDAKDRATNFYNDLWAYNEDHKKFRNDLQEQMSNVLSNINAFVGVGTRLLKLLIDAICADSGNVNVMQLLVQQSEINKLSLDCMRDNRGIVHLKMWNGWKYKYVMIKDIDLKKSGEYEKFYEGSITVQEVPIMCVSLKGSEVKDSITEKPLLFALMKSIKTAVQTYIKNNEKKEQNK